MDGPEFKPQYSQEIIIFVFSKMSRPALWLLFNGYQVLTGGVCVRLPRCKVNHSPPSSAGVKNEWSYTLNLCLHGMDRENFTAIFFTSLKFMITIQRNAQVLHGNCTNCKWICPLRQNYVVLRKYFKLINENA